MNYLFLDYYIISKRKTRDKAYKMIYKKYWLMRLLRNINKKSQRDTKKKPILPDFSIRANN